MTIRMMNLQVTVDLSNSGLTLPPPLQAQCTAQVPLSGYNYQSLTATKASDGAKAAFGAVKTINFPDAVALVVVRVDKSLLKTIVYGPTAPTADAPGAKVDDRFQAATTAGMWALNDGGDVFSGNSLKLLTEKSKTLTIWNLGDQDAVVEVIFGTSA